jgi:hypothetical protein
MTRLAALLLACALACSAQSPVVTVTWKDAGPPGSKYTVLRQRGNCVSAAATVASGLTVSFYVDKPRAGEYCYQVVAIGAAVRYSNSLAIAVGANPITIALVLR